jgi:thiol:disulfide interchange protein DsbD
MQLSLPGDTMNKKLFVLFLCLSSTIKPVSFNHHEIHKSSLQTDVTIAVKLAPEEEMYKESLIISSNHPHVSLSSWQSNIPAQTVYNKRRKENNAVFNESFTLATTATKQTDVPVHDCSIHLMCSTNQSTQPAEKFLPISFTETTLERETASLEEAATVSCQPTKSSVKKEETFDIKRWVKSVQNTLTQTDSWILRFLFALLLGIMLSLTPCIYPMVPITVGVLQSQGSKSLFKNFCLSFAYTLGISTTFSLFGLLAATSGEAFGHMMGNPIFVVCIVALLLYFALSLFGLYNLYIPRFLQQKQSIGGGGSFVSIFMFGLISGSVASPCLSPGLALILTMVAAMANKFLGFLLLFAFGIGISTPLLIIGTFSGSINLLPRAGGWMIEIQRIFGFMLFGMCFYYLSNITPWWIILIMLTMFALCSGLYYLRSASTERSTVWKNIKNILGVIGIASSVYLAVESFQEIYFPSFDDGIEKTWYTDYHQAVADAKAENKKLFLDFWAPYCTLCKLITSTVLKHPTIAKIMSKHYIFVSINGNDATLEPYKTLKERYKIQGFPNLLIVDPETGKELRRWQGEIEDEEIGDVATELEKYSN